MDEGSRAGKGTSSEEEVRRRVEELSAGGEREGWALAGATFGLWGAAAPAVGDANDYIDSEDIYAKLWNELIPGDAMPTDYVMDAQGTIRSIERMYRGPWTLVEPYPWN